MSGDVARWTQEQFDAHMAKFHPGKPEESCHSKEKPSPRVTCSRTQPKHGVMNKLEAHYSVQLETRKQARDIDSWAYESVTLKLAEGCRYTPDFMVSIGPKIQMVEVKRRWRNAKQRGPNFLGDARPKLLTAAKLFPMFDFVLAWYDGASWHEELIAK